MFGGDDEEGDFLSPSGGAKLASLFGLDKEGVQGNESFQYTAPKQPKKSSNSAPATQKPAPPPGAPAVLFATAVQAFRYINGQYVKQGKLGAAVLGNHTTKEYKLLLYLSQQKQVTAAKIHMGFVFMDLGSSGTDASILFVDFSPVLNTNHPVSAAEQALPAACARPHLQMDHNFLSDWKQQVKPGKHISDSSTISTGSPQGCVLSPLVFSLYTNSCNSSHQSVKLLKFADDTTLIGLISGGDAFSYRLEIDHLKTCCRLNNIEFNVLKTVESGSVLFYWKTKPHLPRPYHPV